MSVEGQIDLLAVAKQIASLAAHDPDVISRFDPRTSNLLRGLNYQIFEIGGYGSLQEINETYSRAGLGDVVDYQTLGQNPMLKASPKREIAIPPDPFHVLFDSLAKTTSAQKQDLVKFKSRLVKLNPYLGNRIREAFLNVCDASQLFLENLIRNEKLLFEPRLQIRTSSCQVSERPNYPWQHPRRQTLVLANGQSFGTLEALMLPADAYSANLRILSALEPACTNLAA